MKSARASAKFNRTRALCATAAIGLFISSSAPAAIIVWSGLDGTDNVHWQVPGNWNPSGAPAPGTDSLRFPTTTGNRATNNDFPANSQFNGLDFPGAGYTLAGNAINLGGNITCSATGSGGELISLIMALQQDTDVSVTSTFRVDVSGDIQGNFGLSKSGTGTMRWTTVQKTYTGDTTINGGTLDLVTTDNTMPSGAGKGNLIINSGGTLLLNNTNQGINGLSGAGVVNKSGSNTKTFTVGNNNANGNFTGTITMTGTGGNSGVTKVGTGTQTFGGNVTLPGSGALTTNGGTSLVNAVLAAASTTVASGATLGGTGTLTLTGACNVNGTLAPGASGPGVISVSTTSGNFSATGSFADEIGGNTPGNTSSNYDQANFTNSAGTVALNAATALSLNVVNGFTPSPSDVYYILTRADAGAFATLFAGTTEGGTVNLGGGYQGQITYLANWTGTQAGSSLTGGNDVAIYNVQAVPEPTAGLASLVAAGLLNLPRRRRRSV
jgi:autotransporter-associated beta strand protein